MVTERYVAGNTLENKSSNGKITMSVISQYIDPFYMKNIPVVYGVIEIGSFLSFLLFFLTTDYLAMPMFLAFLVTIFTERTFINVTFGLGVLAYLISIIPVRLSYQLVFKMAYIVLSLLCIGTIFFGKPAMFIETPTLISAIAFVVFTGLFIWKWISNFLLAFRSSDE